MNHHGVARRLVRVSRRLGREGVYEIAEDMTVDDLLAVTELLARMVWSPDTIVRGLQEMYTEVERKDAHRRYRLGERTAWVEAGEREYRRMTSRALRDRKKAGAA